MMDRVFTFIAKLKALFTQRQAEDAFDEEVSAHLQMLTEMYQREGMSNAAATRAARRQFGNSTLLKQQQREARTTMLFGNVWQDVCFCMRQFSRRPGFSLAAILTLALGFAASIAIFAFVDAAMIKPLPYRNPERLAYVTETADIMGPANLSWQDYLDWKQQSTSFESFAVWRYAGGPMRFGAELVPMPGMSVSANFLSTLGLHPQIGRDFNASDNLFGAARVVLLTDGVWRERFHSDPDVVGRAVEIGGDSYAVIGVLPRGFQFAPRGKFQYVGAIAPRSGSCEARRSCHALIGVGRLRDGVSISLADAEVKRIATSLQALYPDSNRGQGGIALPLSEEVLGKIRPVLYTLLAASLLLCAIACINVASLLLTRSEGRRREFALRSALGATRVRMLRQFAVESATLILAGGVVGVAGAVASVRAIMLLVPQSMRNQMPFLDSVTLNRDTFLFAAVLALMALAVFTFVPSLRMSWKALQRAIAEGSAGAGSLSWRRLGSMLVVSEVAVSIVLLVGAGLLSRSLNNLLHADLNFNSDHLVTFTMDIPSKKFPEDAQRIAMRRQVIDRLKALPGVAGAGYGSLLPLTYNGDTDWVRFPDRPYDGRHIEINGRDASPSYFQTLQAPLLRGRFITEQDTAGKPRVAVVNRKFAEQYFPNQNPLGRTFGNTVLDPKSMKTIVGVVEDVREGALDDPIWPAAYYSSYQTDDGTAIVLRVTSGESQIMEAIPRIVRSVDADLNVADIMTMADRINSSQSATLRRGAAWLSGVFAISALLLCTIGLYSVISYSISMRTREIGVRMALGAHRQSIYVMVMKEASRLSLTGVAFGVLLSVFSMFALRALLFHVSSWDIPTLVVSCALLVFCSIAACFGPARKAALSNPTEALRTD